MRFLVSIALITLVACSEKKKSLDKSGNSKEDSQRTENDNRQWTNHNDSFIEIDSFRTQIKNIKYKEEFLNKDNNLDYYVVKETREITSTLGAMQHDSKITLDFFTRNNGELIKTTTKLTDAISIATDYIHTTRYGCCGSENYDELCTIWTDQTFLTFNSKFYRIEIPNAHTQFYFGYLADARDEEKLILGKLYFTHDLPFLPKDKDTYSSVFKLANTIIFIAKSKEVFDKIVPFTPEMSLVKNADVDKISEYPDHQELHLWSFNNAKSLKGLDFIGLKINFQGEKDISIEIPVKDGFLFGDSSSERIIYVDE